MFSASALRAGAAGHSPAFSLRRVLRRLAKSAQGAGMGTSPDYGFEEKALQQGYLRIVGIDEAGRGALCGPVVAAAVWLDPERIPAGLNDSKALTARQRSLLFDRIVAVADVGVGTADVDEIEALNILRASHLAMIRAIESLRYRPDFALVDGHLLPRRLPVRGEAVVKGDARVLSIAAAYATTPVTDAPPTGIANGFNPSAVSCVASSSIEVSIS